MYAPLAVSWSIKTCLYTILSSSISCFLAGFHIWQPYSTFGLMRDVNRVFIGVSSLVWNTLRTQLQRFLDSTVTFLMWNPNVQSLLMYTPRSLTWSLTSIGSPRSSSCLTVGKLSSPYRRHSNLLELNSMLFFMPTRIYHLGPFGNFADPPWS